jgi:hypothetical protein
LADKGRYSPRRASIPAFAFTAREKKRKEER